MVKYQVTDTFIALADKNRLAIVEILAKQGPLPLSVFASRLRISLPAVTKHTRTLARAGIIQQKKIGRTNMSSLNKDAFKEASEWFLSQQQFWITSFDRLDKHITKVMQNK